MKNYYQPLGINRDSSTEEIKKAYRKLVQKFHPDKNNGDKFFEERFREVQEAYETLSNPYEKGRYDNNYDQFFFGQQSGEKYYNHTKREEPKYKPPRPDPEQVRKEQDNREKREKERKERERVANIKKTSELSFEDKAWIFLGNWFIIPGVVGLWMFAKYRKEGYIKKSNSVCSLTLISFAVLFVLAIIIAIAQAA